MSSANKKISQNGFNILSGDAVVSGKAFIPPLPNRHGLIICHGIPGSISPKQGKKAGYEYMGRFFGAMEFLTLIFNFRGTGESGGNLDPAGWVDDLREVIKYYFRTYGCLSPALILAGFSAGAAVALEVAAEDRRIGAVALGACPRNFDYFVEKYTAENLWSWFQRAGMFRNRDTLPDKEAWIKRFISVRPEDRVASLSPRKLLIMHGDKDETVPPEHAENLYHRAAENKRLVIFPGVKHRLRNSRKVLRYLQLWVEEVEGQS